MTTNDLKLNSFAYTAEPLRNLSGTTGPRP